MNDDEFLQVELRAQEALNEFKDACDEHDEDFNGRVEDLVYNSMNKD